MHGFSITLCHGGQEMYKTPHIRILSSFTIILSVLVLISSVGGLLFEEKLYGLNRPYYVAQIIGQDVANLLLLVPILLISVFFMRRNSRRAFLVWLGAIAYAFYIFAAYGFSLHY